MKMDRGIIPKTHMSHQEQQQKLAQNQNFAGNAARMSACECQQPPKLWLRTDGGVSNPQGQSCAHQNYLLQVYTRKLHDREQHSHGFVRALASWCATQPFAVRYMHAYPRHGRSVLASVPTSTSSPRHTCKQYTPLTANNQPYKLACT